MACVSCSDPSVSAGYCAACVLSGAARQARAVTVDDGAAREAGERLGSFRKAATKRALKREKRLLKAATENNDSGLLLPVRGKAMRAGRRSTAYGFSQKSGFYDPATNIANAINAALSPDAEAPRRFVRKRRKVEPLAAFVGPDGKLLTSRFRGWLPGEVARVSSEGWRFIRWIAAHDNDPALPGPAQRKLRLVLAATRALWPADALVDGLPR